MKNTPGFTLIETIIYLALFSVIIGGGMVAAYQIAANTEANYNHIILEEESNFLLRKINQSLVGAASVDFPAPGELFISNPGAPAIWFKATGSNLQITRGSISTVLNSASVAVLDLSFTATLQQPGVITNLTLSTTRSGKKASEHFLLTNYLQP